MQKSILAGWVILLLFSCQTEQRYTQDSPEIDAVKSVLKAYSEQDYATMTSHYSDTANVYYNSKSNVLKGNQLGEAHSANDANFVSRGFLDENQEFEMVKTDDGETWVNAWAFWKGTINHTNEDVSIPIHITYRFIDGKIVEEHAYWDGAPYMLALEKMKSYLPDEEGKLSNVGIINTCYNLFAQGDLETFFGYLDEKVEWNEAENFIYHREKPYVGKDEFMEFVLKPIGEDWEFWKIIDLKVHDMSDNQVLGTGRYHAVHKTTGKEIKAQVAHLFTLKDGKITRFQQYTDTKQVAEAVK